MRYNGQENLIACLRSKAWFACCRLQCRRLNGYARARICFLSMPLSAYFIYDLASVQENENHVHYETLER